MTVAAPHRPEVGRCVLCGLAAGPKVSERSHVLRSEQLHTQELRVADVVGQKLIQVPHQSPNPRLPHHVLRVILAVT